MYFFKLNWEILHISMDKSQINKQERIIRQKVYHSCFTMPYALLYTSPSCVLINYQYKHE